MTDRQLYYIEINGEAVPCSLEEWAGAMEKADRAVALDHLPNGYTVSTVFLGLDHNFFPDGVPLLYETMVFPPDSYDEQDQDRCTTRAQAYDMHAAMVVKWESKPPYVKEAAK